MRSTRQPAFMSMSTSPWHRYELPRCSWTHWGPSNIAAIWQMTISNAFSWMKIFEFKGTINNTSALIRIMAWRRIGDKSLSEPMVAYFSDAYIRQSASLSWHIEDVTKWPTWLQTTFDLNENQGVFFKFILNLLLHWFYGYPIFQRVAVIWLFIQHGQQDNSSRNKPITQIP